MIQVLSIEFLEDIPMEVKKRKSNNDVKHSHGWEKRRPSTLKAELSPEKVSTACVKKQVMHNSDAMAILNCALDNPCFFT